MTQFRGARALGLIACQSCGLVSRVAADGGPRPVQEAARAGAGARENTSGPGGCPGCGIRLRSRKPYSLVRTTTYLVVALALFLPANLLPVLTTRTLLGAHADTILSGVVVLWKKGSWWLAILIFAASILLPGVKLAALALLVLSVRLRSAWRRRERTQLFRLVERWGRWSMLDIFVMALLAALVRSPAAGVEINAGAVAFAAVVALTMLSSASFDPRLIWDAQEGTS